MGRFYSGDIEGKFWFGIQASDDASFFGVGFEEDIDEETGENIEENIVYFFEERHISKVKNGIEICKKELGINKTKIDKFFKSRDAYTDKELGIFLNKTKIKAKDLLVWYARLELGNKILKCLKKKERCYFTGEC